MDEEQGYGLKVGDRWVSALRICGNVIFSYTDNAEPYKMSKKIADRLIKEFYYQGIDKQIKLIECGILTDEECENNKNLRMYFMANHKKLSKNM